MNKKNSLQTKTMNILILFSIIILFLMWATQILFLNTSYEKYQINTLKKVESKLNNNTFSILELEQLAYKNNICMEYVYNGEVYIFNGLNNNCILNNKKINISTIITTFIKSNKYKEIIKLNNPLNNSKSILYSIKLSDNGYVFLNTALEDVDSTTSVLRNQLIYITMLIIILAIIVSIYLSKMINKPIINITNEAKKLAKGNNEINIEKSNIKEIDDLASVLNYASKEINKTDELRRDLLANVSHDLKTPLTMIKAYAEMLRDIKYDEKTRKENLNIIIEETDRLNILVNDILNLSKLEANKDTLTITEFDLVELINNIIKKFNIIKETENYKFNLTLPKKAIVKGDYNKINQVIYNLVSNAVNYTGKSKTISIEVIEKKKTYLVNIIDYGKGIKKEDLSLIWNKYYKNEKNHKRNKIGTGIGLSIVKNILDRHKFTYGVNSQINKGTTFYFEIIKIS
ncbi:MAG: HAMP domain-containing histidine kinase [Bacilli bacterium]|nr:HAMP domain-containing histidine kinase [Bacilli bacterium]